MSKANVLQTIELASLKGGKIILTHMEHPYGETSHPVVSIGVSLKGGEQDWQVHIPYENIDELISALQAAKNNQEG
jgi:hypothetical protein